MSLMIKNAHAILSGLPGEAARLAGPDIRIRDGKIAAIGSLTPLPEERQIDARDCVIYPAWVNTHHHLFQSLLKGEPQGLNQSLTAWLSATPYRFRAAFDEHTFRLAVRIGLVELLRSGCASVADHNYLYWPEMPFDTSEIVFSEGKRWGCASFCAGVGRPRVGRWNRICRWRCVRKPSTAIWRISNGWSAAITTPGPILCAGW